MSVLFSKRIRSSTTAPRYSSVFVGDEVAKEREQQSTIPAPIRAMLTKNGIETPPPGAKLDLSKLDYFLRCRKTSLDDRLALKGALAQCGLI